MYDGAGVFVISANYPLISEEATFLEISLIALGITPSSSRIIIPPLAVASGCKSN
jgi:hypothetical protein